MDPVAAGERGSWASRAGFILAAAGSAVGLGNIWKFPYVTGRNGGGLFVLLYLACIAAVALPIMVAEILVGRATQRSPVAAFRQLSGSQSPWILTGWLGVAAGFVILSFYCVVAGWSVYYAFIAVFRGFAGMAPATISGMFGGLLADSGLNVSLTGVFMVMTVAVVIGGVQAGIERWSRILMPLLFLMLLGLVGYGMTLPGRSEALGFMFGLHTEQLRPAGVLEGMGQAFFSLSLGMGALLTYGSYLPKSASILKSSLWVAMLDTLVALLSSLMIFPITFTHGIEPSSGPGLVFESIPLAFSQMVGGRLLGIVFFSLLVFAALTSAVSLLEVVVSTLIDLGRWSRRAATLATAVGAYLLSIPSALSQGSLFGDSFKRWVGTSFFDLMDNISSNWMLPLGGMLIALYVGWVMPSQLRDEEFVRHTGTGSVTTWLVMLKVVAPVAVLLVLLRTTGMLSAIGFNL